MPETNFIPTGSSHVISLSTAVAMTSSFRLNREIMLASEFRGRDVLPLSETFNRAAIDLLLAQEGCAAIRIYYGADPENGQVHVILVGVNDQNEDLVGVSSRNNDTDPVIMEFGQRCPPSCPPASPLNP